MNLLSLYTVMFGNITDIITMIKSSYGSQSELDETQILKTITEDIDLLIIDDLGKDMQLKIPGCCKIR